MCGAIAAVTHKCGFADKLNLNNKGAHMGPHADLVSGIGSSVDNYVRVTIQFSEKECSFHLGPAGMLKAAAGGTVEGSSVEIKRPGGHLNVVLCDSIARNARRPDMIHHMPAPAKADYACLVHNVKGTLDAAQHKIKTIFVPLVRRYAKQLRASRT